MTLNLKKGDNVKVLAGKDKGKTGKVVNIDRKSLRVTVDGVNTQVRHERAKKAGQKGQKVTVPKAMDWSKVMMVCPNCNKPTRLGSRVDEKGNKHRVCKKCRNDI
jgi:large subunit ribosomal protein L24